ncbi:response regulator transcription factor [Sphingomonas sp. GCM10030256]|uniref:response regulator transcription factor n=1 Tax=Sphingomonas sp. GCM10030256 TaxID=3273427 RepID=UPI00361C4791
MSELGRIYVLDDDADLSASLARLIAREGYETKTFVEPAALEQACRVAGPDAILTDIMMGEDNGFDVAESLRSVDPSIAWIFMTAWPHAHAAVDAVRRHQGVDYLAKPIDEERLLAACAQAVGWSRHRRAAYRRLASLTPREWDVFRALCRGLSNKMIAAELDIKPKTVEDHRASIMVKTQAVGLAALIELQRAIDRRD